MDRYTVIVICLFIFIVTIMCIVIVGCTGVSSDNNNNDEIIYETVLT